MAKCPYCENEVTLNSDGYDRKNTVNRELKGTLKKEVMYSCPHCDRILGFGYFFGGLLTGRP